MTTERTFLVMQKSNRIPSDGFGIDRFDAWNILLALFKAALATHPREYWYPRNKNTYIMLAKKFREVFEFTDLPDKGKWVDD